MASPAPLGYLGKFALERLLGRGGMGSVYLARQTDLEDRLVALKVISREYAQDRRIVERLTREAKSAARINSDFVVRVFETGSENGVPYIAMEYVAGISVLQLLQKRGGKLAPREATTLAVGAARALAVAHAAGVIHRDVKPGNILITPDWRVKLADFGLAKVERREAVPQAKGPLSIPGEVLGTPDYMSPEQADGETLDPRADLYSLGVTYYELLTGVRPFRGPTTMATLARVFAGNFTPPRQLVPDLPEAAERACVALMARERNARPASAQAALELFAKVFAELEGGKSPNASGHGKPLAASGPRPATGVASPALQLKPAEAPIVVAPPADDAPKELDLAPESRDDEPDEPDLEPTFEPRPGRRTAPAPKRAVAGGETPFWSGPGPALAGAVALVLVIGAVLVFKKRAPEPERPPKDDTAFVASLSQAKTIVADSLDKRLEEKDEGTEPESVAARIAREKKRAETLEAKRQQLLEKQKLDRAFADDALPRLRDCLAKRDVEDAKKVVANMQRIAGPEPAPEAKPRLEWVERVAALVELLAGATDAHKPLGAALEALAATCVEKPATADLKCAATLAAAATKIAVPGALAADDADPWLQRAYETLELKAPARAE